MNKRSIGNKYEDLACEYLKKEGYGILTRNFFSRLGEIDIVARDENYLCFIEVKYRKHKSLTQAILAITPAKQKKIIYTAKYYLLKNKLVLDTPCRFDVVSIDGDKIMLIKNAFQE